ELMIGGKRMKQNNRGAAAQDFVENFRVAAGDPLHAGITGPRLPGSRLPGALFYVVVTCWPAGAVSASGSFGITIHATIYAHRPTVGGIRATISHTTRTTVTSISKYFATARLRFCSKSYISPAPRLAFCSTSGSGWAT